MPILASALCPPFQSASNGNVPFARDNRRVRMSAIIDTKTGANASVPPTTTEGQSDQKSWRMHPNPKYSTHPTWTAEPFNQDIHSVQSEAPELVQLCKDVSELSKRLFGNDTGTGAPLTEVFDRIRMGKRPDVSSWFRNLNEHFARDLYDVPCTENHELMTCLELIEATPGRERDNAHYIALATGAQGSVLTYGSDGMDEQARRKEREEMEQALMCYLKLGVLPRLVKSLYEQEDCRFHEVASKICDTASFQAGWMAKTKVGDALPTCD